MYLGNKNYWNTKKIYRKKECKSLGKALNKTLFPTDKIDRKSVV